MYNNHKRGKDSDNKPPRSALQPVQSVSNTKSPVAMYGRWGRHKDSDDDPLTRTSQHTRPVRDRMPPGAGYDRYERDENFDGDPLDLPKRATQPVQPVQSARHNRPPEVVCGKLAAQASANQPDLSLDVTGIRGQSQHHMDEYHDEVSPRRATLPSGRPHVDHNERSAEKLDERKFSAST
jgi:hypothetical protein